MGIVNIMDEVIDRFISPSASISPASSTLDTELATKGSPISNMHTGSHEKTEDELRLDALPAEIINQILSFLPPVSLAHLSCTSRLIRTHAHNELLWSDFVHENLPNGERLESPTPAKSWRHLYIAHHPYWFLVRHKVWFADVPNTGKIILARYNKRRGRIEAHQLLAEHGAHTYEAWVHNPEVIVHTFNPRIRLWTNDPVVMLDLNEETPGPRLRKELMMPTGLAHGICSVISLCQPIPKPLQCDSMQLWPPAIIPFEQRVRNQSNSGFRSEAHRPQNLDLMSDQTFRIRKWLDRSNLANFFRMGEEVMTFSTLLEMSYRPTKEKPYQGIWVGDYSGHGCEFLLVLQHNVSDTTIMTREPAIASLPEGLSMARVERESLEERDAGIRQMIEDESATLQDTYRSLIAGPSTEVPERMSEPESNYAGPSSSAKGKSKVDPGKTMDDSSEDLGCSGRLEAIKLTGDINVPRGQYTWIAEDIGPKGFIRIGKEQMFNGARIVKSYGRIAGRGFKHDRFIPSQLILVSHDTVAQYWEVSQPSKCSNTTSMRPASMPDFVILSQKMKSLLTPPFNRISVTFHSTGGWISISISALMMLLDMSLLWESSLYA